VDIRKTILICAVPFMAAFAASSAVAQTALQSPAQVQTALGTLSRVVNHTQRLITAGNYARLPHENEEFKEGLEALEHGIAKDPAGFKAKVAPLLQQARAGSQGVADAAPTHDEARLAAAHTALADSVKAVLAAFPDSVQPAH
jgi:hypothetical protein